MRPRSGRGFFWQRETLGKDEGLDGDIRESFHLPHTVYLSALHGSQAALKSRFLMTHPAGIKQFPSRLMAKQLRGLLKSGSSSSSLQLNAWSRSEDARPVPEGTGVTERQPGDAFPQTYRKLPTWFFGELNAPCNSVGVSDTPPSGADAERTGACSGMANAPGSNQPRNGKTGPKMGSVERKKAPNLS